MLLGKSVGILPSPLTEHAARSPYILLVQLQKLGHDDATPTSKITTTVVAIRNCMLCRKSTNTKTECIYLIVISIAVLHVYIKCREIYIVWIFIQQEYCISKLSVYLRFPCVDDRMGVAYFQVRAAFQQYHVKKKLHFDDNNNDVCFVLNQQS